MPLGEELENLWNYPLWTTDEKLSVIFMEVSSIQAAQ